MYLDVVNVLYRFCYRGFTVTVRYSVVRYVDVYRRVVLRVLYVFQWNVKRHDVTFASGVRESTENRSRLIASM